MNPSSFLWAGELIPHSSCYLQKPTLSDPSALGAYAFLYTLQLSVYLPHFKEALPFWLWSFFKFLPLLHSSAFTVPGKFNCSVSCSFDVSCHISRPTEAGKINILLLGAYPTSSTKPDTQLLFKRPWIATHLPYPNVISTGISQRITFAKPLLPCLPYPGHTGLSQFLLSASDQCRSM